MPEKAGNKKINGIPIGTLGDFCRNIHIAELAGNCRVITIERKHSSVMAAIFIA